MSKNSQTVYYHGTNKDFDSFDMSFATKSTKAELGELGFFFTPDPVLASDFCRNKWSSKRSKYKKGANVRPVYLSIENPFRIEPLEIIQISNSLDKGAVANLRKRLILKGYDGVIINSDEHSKRFIKRLNEFKYEQHIAFYDHQIKSIFYK